MAERRARRARAPGRITGKATVLVALMLASVGRRGQARASEQPKSVSPPSVALIIGSNRGGPGQADLQFAEDDARHVAMLLGSLGGYGPGEIALLLRPTRGDVERALDALAAQIEQARQRGSEVQALFYYSGHARASALNLGDEELALPDLRARLLAMPSRVTIVLLDACQSGAISRIKGAEPTADFSFNSVNRLTTAGIAVMASSSANELSQESESLRSSYFTHHLLVGLRGAGDADRDGRITLGEAYRYAYNQTLAATAATAVGSQHATLETGLRGKGEIVLTYPAAASSQLELPAALGGELLVRLEPAGTIMAEMHKVPGQAMRLALPPGRYVAIARQSHRTRRCDLALADRGTAVLNVAGCPEVDASTVAVKGGAAPPLDRWTLQEAAGDIGARNARYVERLGDFGFENSIHLGVPRLSISVARGVRRSFAIGLEATSLDERTFRRHSAGSTLSGQDERFWWATYGLGAFAEISYPLWRDHLIPYARVGAGLTFARTSYQEIDPAIHAVKGDDSGSDLGYLVRAAAGLGVMPWRHLGFFIELNATRAPTVDNLVGDVHDSGGPGALLGVRGAL